MSELHVPGVSVAFIENGQVKWARAYGVMAVGAPQPVTPSTLFQAASMSKAFAAAAALKLVEQGRLDLDADVNSELKSWKVPPSPYTAEKKVTLRALLSHSAGLTVGGFPGYALGAPVPTVQQILDGQPPQHARRSVLGGARRLCLLRRRLHGGPADDRRGGRQTLSGPAAGPRPRPGGHAGLDLRPAAAPGPPGRRRQRSQPTGRGDRRARHTYPEYAAAGLWTTPSDYGRFMIGLQNAYAGRPHALMRQASAQAMMTPVDAGYALGVTRGLRGGHPWFEHGGSNEGFQSEAVAFLDGSRQGVIVMTNGDAGGALAGQIVTALSGAYGWGEADPGNKRSPRRAPYVRPPPPK